MNEIKLKILKKEFKKIIICLKTKKNTERSEWVNFIVLKSKKGQRGTLVAVVGILTKSYNELLINLDRSVFPVKYHSRLFSS